MYLTFQGASPLTLNFHLLLSFCSLFCFDLLTALLEVILASKDCLVAGDSCSSDETCSPRLRTLRQCVAGNGSMKLGPGARSQCANAVSALLSSPLHGCQCKRGMKKEKNCLSIYWSLHQSIIHGQLFKDIVKCCQNSTLGLTDKEKMSMGMQELFSCTEFK